MEPLVKIEYPTGDYPFAAPADVEPGDVVVRPSGTLAIVHGLQGFKAGEDIHATPVSPKPTGMWPANSGDTWKVSE